MRISVSRFFAAAALCAVLMAGSLAAGAQVVLFGTLGVGGNMFPFGGSFFTGTRYQQVYNASKFAGPIVIEEVSFFATAFVGLDFVSNTFSLSLSTTSKPVNGLSTVFTDNVGADNTLIEAKALSGPMPSKWTFSGGTFLYDPSLGNLLVDIIPAVPIAPGFSGAADAMNGTFGTDSSRMHDFGTEFASWGLVTEFKGHAPTNNQVPEPGALALLLGFALVGGGMALRRRR